VSVKGALELRPGLAPGPRLEPGFGAAG